MHASDPPYAHNDLKPGNVLFSSKKGDLPVAIVMDFGSAAPARRSIRSRSEALALQVSSSAYVTVMKMQMLVNLKPVHALF